MMDIIAGAFGTLRTASEITQGLLALKTDAAVSAKVVELNQVIFEVQQQLFSAQMDYAKTLDRVRELEEQLAANDDLKKYRLVQFQTGTLVYGLTDEVESQDVEVSHYICPNCYSAGRKAILQPNQNYLVCNIPGCKFVVATSPYKPRPPRNWRTI